MRSPSLKAQASRTVWRLTVRLVDVEPTVWRTILVRPEMKLSMLHRYLQAAMGWREYHLFSFTIGGRRYGIPNPDFKLYDARRYTLARLFPTIPARFDYLYDFGDHWDHRIEIEGQEEPVYRRQYPICIAGEEPCPPEDCGGPGGYALLRSILMSPSHPQHAELSAWSKLQFYPRRFDPQSATWTMRDVQRGFI
jgi:hypothetical protein